MIQFENICKRFKDKSVIEDICFDVPAGRCLVLYGPSGCGKTTLLRLAAGFEKPDQGRIWIAGRVASSPRQMVRPNDRGISMVFQDLALWPHMSIHAHLDFSLSAFQKSKTQRRQTIKHTLDRVGLTADPAKLPHQLSGGEKQRLALARVLVCQPDVLLMDEPLSSLDTMLKRKILGEIKALINTTGAATIYVTHDLQEALFIGDLLATIDSGRIQSMEAMEAYRINPSVTNKNTHDDINSTLQSHWRRAGQ